MHGSRLHVTIAAADDTSSLAAAIESAEEVDAQLKVRAGQQTNANNLRARSLDWQRDGDGLTPLMQAAISNVTDNERIVQMLLDAGAKVNARQEVQPYVRRTKVTDADKEYDEARRDKLGATALHVAALA